MFRPTACFGLTSRGTQPTQSLTDIAATSLLLFGMVVGSLLGLLAFIIAITVSIAISRFEERRQTALQEANAISTT